MVSLDSMKGSLRPLGIYQLEKSLVEHELEAYGSSLDKAAGFQENLEEAFFLEKLKKEESSLEKGVQHWEEICGFPKTNGISLEERLTRVKAWLAVCSTDSTVTAIEKTALALGLQLEIEEHFDDGKISLNIREAPSGEEGEAARKLIERLLPAHLECLWVNAV